MRKDWFEMARELNNLVASRRCRQADMMRAFSQQAQAALKPAATDTKAKELIALALSPSAQAQFYPPPRRRHVILSREPRQSDAADVYFGRGPQLGEVFAHSLSGAPVDTPNCGFRLAPGGAGAPCPLFLSEAWAGRLVSQRA